MNLVSQKVALFLLGAEILESFFSSFFSYNLIFEIKLCVSNGKEMLCVVRSSTISGTTPQIKVGTDQALKVSKSSLPAFSCATQPKTTLLTQTN